MDRWKYFDITHRNHVICNPLSVAKLDELAALVDLRTGARVLDIGCGKAEFLIRLAERFDISGDGVDLSPFVIAEARARVAERVPSANLTFHQEDGGQFAAEAASYDLAACLGATWAFGGYRGTLRALGGFVRPGGLVVVGEPHWRGTPPADYLEASGYPASAWGTLQTNVSDGEEEGLTSLYVMASSDDDWDRYAGLQWRAAARYAVDHPGDPDTAEVVAEQRKHRELYLRWERELVGWAVHLFMRPG